MAPDLPGLVQQIAHFEARLQSDPGSRVFLPLADLYRRAGRLSEARRILEAGLEDHPGFVTARAALGLVLAEMGEAADARAALGEVLQADPDNLLALRLLAADAGDRGQWDDACRHYERLLRLEPEAPAVRHGLREARAKRDAAVATPATPTSPAPPTTPEPAAEPTAPASAGAPTPAAPAAPGGFETPTLAELYLRQGHVEKARVILERILAADPGREDARRVLAKVEAASTAPAPAGDGGEAPGEGKPLAAAGNGGGADPAVGRELDRFRSWLDGAGNGGSVPD